MRDIRRPYHNSRSKNKEKELLNNSKMSSKKSREMVDDISRKTELYEKKEYQDIDYTRDGKPVMRAREHFDLANGPERRGRRRGEDFDVLKRGEFFNSKRKTFDDEEVEKFRKAKNRKSKFAKSLFYGLIFLAITTLIVMTFVFNKATITINPKYKDIDVNNTFLIFKDDIITDTATSTLSKVVLKSEPKEVNQKAEGELTIYNNYSADPQVLIRNTRFQSPEGKIFKIADSVTVPGKKGDVAGAITVKVSADSYGADYNIEPTKFTIPGLKGTSRYNAFYAKSTNKMSGGMSGMVQIVADSDINQAQVELEPKVKDDLLQKLKKFTHDGYYTLYNSPIITYSNNANELITSDKPTFEITGLATIFSIKEDVLAKMLAEQYLGDEYNVNQGVRLANVNNLNIEVATDTDPNTNLLKLNITGKVRIIWTYNEAQLKKDLANQKTNTFSTVIENYNYAIVNARSSVKPVWIKSFPKDIAKIKLVEEIK